MTYIQFIKQSCRTVKNNINHTLKISINQLCNTVRNPEQQVKLNSKQFRRLRVVQSELLFQINYFVQQCMKEPPKVEAKQLLLS